MKITTLRLPEEMYSSLEAEAEAEEMSVSEYVREILRDRENTQANTQGNTPTDRDRLAEAVDELTERVAEVEQRQANPDRTDMADTGDGGGRSSGRESGGRRPETTNPDRATGENSDDSELAGLEFPTGRDRAACVAAIHAARSFVDERDGASMREIVTNVMPDHPIGYDVPQLEPGDRYRGSWWRKIVKPGLEALDVEKPRGGGEWSIDDTEAGGVYDPTAEF